ncbi:MAG: molybdate ABC transporter substrate-binding protein [Myxococcales bacterium]|jgi:molybdate transport system substrate-binding protein
MAYALLPVLALLVGCHGKPAEPLRVAAAADLSHAFAELTPAFNAQHPVDLKLTSGASGLLAKQVEQGAPFDLFLSANVGYVDQVVKAGACDGSTVERYARGQLVIWVKGADGAQLSPSSLVEERFKHIAIANPEHAPYGKAAKEALTKAGVWDRVVDRMVYGENVQQTQQLARSGNADVAIVGLSLALGSSTGSWAVVDEALYSPLDQALVVCKHGSNVAAARQLAEFLKAPAGRGVLRKYGFLLPGEALAKAP